MERANLCGVAKYSRRYLNYLRYLETSQDHFYAVCIHTELAKSPQSILIESIQSTNFALNNFSLSNLADSHLEEKYHANVLILQALVLEISY